MGKRNRSRSGSHSRSRSRSRKVSKRRRHRNRSTCSPRSRSRSDSGLRESLKTIVARLNALEDRSSVAMSSNVEVPSTNHDSTEKIVKAIQSIKYGGSTRDFYVSNFDPNVHDVDAWFDEVDRAQILNKWNDAECLSRIGHCLKGDAKSWLDDWVTTDRSWSNFKRDFKSLCVKKIDVANILYEVMSTNSDSFTTYAEYVRRSLLRLQIVKGLSNELISAIIIRGINEPNIKAAATNENLKPCELVNYFSSFVKPVEGTHEKRLNRDAPASKEVVKPNFAKRPVQKTPLKCFSCGQTGHKIINCHAKQKPSTTSTNTANGEVKSGSKIVCAYCKKTGHHINDCFAKQRSDNRKSNVNFCSLPDINNCKDVIVGVIQGIPIDILIDSGALDVSLISSSVVNHLSCATKTTYRELKGVGNTITRVFSYVTLTIEFKEITLEADLLVVPSESMNAPIIIGTDVLNREGVMYVRTKDYQRLTFSAVPAKVSAIESNEHPIQTSLDVDNKKKLIEILNEFSKFMITGTATSTVTTDSMHIRLNSVAPVYYRPYKLSFNEKLRVREIINDLLAKGIIRESESAYASPILLIKKKDGTDRLCVDFRALNRITVKDRYPLPLIEDHIDRLGKGKYFTTLDMASGFYQIRLDNASIPLTGFVTPEGHYEYMKMPFGLANAPVVFQRIISNTLRSFINNGTVIVYIDDVLLVSNSVDEGLNILRDVLRTLSDAGFSLNMKKCSFLGTEIEYLGRVISNGKVRPSKSKITALVNSLKPENVRQVRQFLGLAGYFRKYIENYALKTSCIARLTKKDEDFKWGEEQDQARDEIIKCLTSEPILAIFDPDLETEVHTDASCRGYGAVLLQIGMDSRKSVVAYYSQVTHGAEVRYHSYELETLAVRHFRHCLIGIEFKVITDCNALKATQNKKDLLPRVARWWVYLQDFTFTIVYRKGVLLPHADYLSRNPIRVVNNIDRPRNWAQVAQSGDDETQKLLRQLEEGQLDASRYVKNNEILYYRYSPVGEQSRLLCFIPKGHRLSLLRIFHDEHCHIGVDKTIGLILNHFWFPGLHAFVKKYIGHCLTCIANKRVPRAPLQPITSWTKPDVAFHTLHADVLGPLPESNGYKHILVLVDAFSKYCLTYPLYRQDHDELKKAFKNAVSLFGTPHLIVTDRGRMFEATNFVKWINDLGCTIHYITPEMHHANGQVERYVRTLLNMLRVETNNKKSKWSEQLWRLQLVLNVTKQKTTQASPLNLLIGIEGTTPVIQTLVRDVTIECSDSDRRSLRELDRQRAAERLKENQSRQDKYVNKMRQPPHVFQKDDLAFVIKYAQSKGKLDSGMRGPYKVTRVLENGRYELKLIAGAYGKVTYAAAQFMVPWKGEWTPDECAAFFACADQSDETMPLTDGEAMSEVQTTPAYNDEEAGPSRPAEDVRMSGEAV